MQKVRALPGCDADRFVAAFGLPKRFTRARLVVVTCEHLLLLKEDGSEYIKCNMHGFSKVMRVAPGGLGALTHTHKPYTRLQIHREGSTLTVQFAPGDASKDWRADLYSAQVAKGVLAAVLQAATFAH